MSTSAAAPPLPCLGRRADFPLFTAQPQLTFLDSAASTQKPQAVIDAISGFYAHEYANIHRGAYRLSSRATDRYEAVRAQAAAFFRAPAEQGVVFTRNATEAVNLVASCWSAAHLGAGDRILVSEMEHHANLVPWQLAAQRHGAEVVGVRMTPDGRLDLDDYAAWLRDERVKFVALQHVSNVLGTVHPAALLVEMAHARGLPILLDGAQAAPHLPLNLSELGADFYVLSSHKMCGPSGVGLLLARPEALRGLPPYQGGGDMIREVWVERSTYQDIPGRFEAGTPAIAEVVGFGAALDYLSGVGMAQVRAHETALVELALTELRAIGGVELYGPADERGGAVSFNVRGAHAHDVAGFLDEAGICVRAGHHCAQPLMRALGTVSTVRASFYLYNTPDDVSKLARELRDITEFLGEEGGEAQA